MSDYLTSLIRTVVPAAWATLLAWLVSIGVPGGLAELLSTVGGVVLVPIVVGAVYAGLRWLEPRLPSWLAAILLGSAQQPTYPTAVGDPRPFPDTPRHSAG